jgi:uncharacterized membrane protein YfcA
MIIDQTIVFYVMLAVVICLIGLSKGGFGGMMGALGTPLLALILPADTVIGLLLPILIIADVFAVASHWKKWNNKLVVLLLPGAILGVFIGTLFITNVSPLVLRRVLGVIALLFAGYKLFESVILGATHYQPRNWHGVTAGTIAGFSSSLAHTGGPPITIYLLMQEITPRTFVATSALFFMALNWIKVPTYFYADLFDFKLLWQVAWLLPLLPISVWVGKSISTRINKVLFDRIILAFLALSGVLLLVR